MSEPRAEPGTDARPAAPDTPVALLLAAGKATRLAGLRERWAKACVPVGGTTPLRHLIEALAAAGVRHFVVNLHWRAEQVRAQTRAALPDGCTADFLSEEELFGTGGTLRAVAARLGRVPELMVNAKLFTDLDWARLLAAPAGTLVVHPASPLTEFGGLLVRDDATGPRLAGLWPRERARAGERPPGDARAAVYTGICRPDPDWLSRLANASAAPATPAASAAPLCLARAGFLAAAADGERVPVLAHDGFWCEISTPERVESARARLAALR